MFLIRLSVKSVLGLVMGAAGLMLLALAVPPLYGAIILQHAVERTDKLVSISSALLHALQSQRMERSTLGAALQADWIIKPDTAADVARYRGVTDPSYQQAVAAIPQLDLPDIKPSLDRLIQAHITLADLRPRADEAARHPLTERPAGLAKTWSDAGLAQLNALEALADVVDAALQLTDTRLDQLLAVKRAAWVARNFFGTEMLTSVDALAARKPWDVVQIYASAQANGRAMDAWSVVATAATRPAAPMTLKQAYTKVKEDYFGTNIKVRQPVSEALLQGRVPEISANDYLQLMHPSLATINDLASAALDAMTVRSADLKRSAWNEILLRTAELALSTVLILSGFMIVLLRVSRPLLSLTDAMGHLASGEYATTVPSFGRHDEIGAMARAVQTFKDNGLKMRRMEAEAVDQRQRAETERARTDAQRAEAAGRLAQVVEGLAGGLAHI